jgi:hypothetical protein
MFPAEYLFRGRAVSDILPIAARVMKTKAAD